MNAKYGKISIGRSVASILLFVVMFTLLGGCLSVCREERFSEEWIAKQAQEYLAGREDIDDALRQSILAGKITVGMFPDEAVAAGGPFRYRVVADGMTMVSVADIRLYFDYVKNKPPRPRIPPDILWMQRTEQMEDVEIGLNFWNRTQYDTEDFVSIYVRFEAGRVSSIERLGDDGEGEELD